MDFKHLEDKIINTYEQGIGLDEAEKLSAEFLQAQITVSRALAKADLDSRMRKQGVKAIRAALYLDAKNKGEKQTEAALTAMLDSNDLVAGEQTDFDIAEAKRDELARYYNIFQSAHVYFRQVSRGVVS